MRLVGVERVRDQIQNVAMLNLQHYHIKCLDLRSIEGHDFNKLNILEKQNLKIKKKIQQVGPNKSISTFSI